MKNYSPLLPRDKGDAVKTAYIPPITALVSTNKENASTSSILLLGHNTTELEVIAIGQTVALKWLTQETVDSSVAGTSVLTAVGTENWDHAVQASTVRRFVVPIATNPQVQSIQGINRELGLYPAVAYKTFAGNGSVLTAQF